MSNTQIIRLYTREMNGAVADATLDPGKDAEVVLEVEASDLDWNEGALFETGLTIKDLDADTSTLVSYEPSPSYSGSMTKDPWLLQDQPFTYKIKAEELAKHAGHMCEAHAYLLGGANNRTACFAVSPTFLVKA